MSLHRRTFLGVAASAVAAINAPQRAEAISVPSNSLLADLTTKQLWVRCIWYSDESPMMKLYLLCIGRFMKEDGTRASISNATIVSDCGFSKDTRKRCAQQARDFWLDVDINKGFGSVFQRQNLFHARIPPLVLSGLLKKEAEKRDNEDASTHNVDGGGGCSQHRGGRGSQHPHRYTSRGIGKKEESKSGFQKVSLQEGKKVRGPVIVARGDGRNLADVLSDDHNPLNIWKGGSE